VPAKSYQQLNNLAGDLISVSSSILILQSSQDYTTGQLENKTDLNVGISKKLLNDRLKITVEVALDLKDRNKKNQEASTLRAMYLWNTKFKDEGIK
jgi:hypothetical protein